MAEIYSRAKQVNVWLGDPDTMRRSKWLFQSLVVALSPPFWANAKDEMRGGRSSAELWAFCLILNLSLSADTRHARHQRGVMVNPSLGHAGVRRCPTRVSMLRRCANTIRLQPALQRLTERRTITNGAYSSPFQRLFSRLTDIDQLRRRVADTETLPTLYEAACATRGNEATDPRDAVYSLLDRISTEVAHLIVPNYTTSVWLVYAEATVASTICPSNFDILQLACGFSGKLDRPSRWYADFPHSHGTNVTRLSDYGALAVVRLP